MTVLARATAARELQLTPEAAAPNVGRVAGCDVLFESLGAVLVIGPAQRAVPVTQRLAESLRVLTCTTDATAGTRIGANPSIMTAAVARLDGHLGRFRAQVRGSGGALVELDRFSPNHSGLFDLVLDLGATPLIDVPVPPLGYFAPADEPGVESAIHELRGLVGRFRKPRYFRYDAETCVHGAQGVSGCSSCIDACPTRAIRSKGDQVEVDPHLCQGCSTCMLLCPTGAMSSSTPAPAFEPPMAEASAAVLVIEEGVAERAPVQHRLRVPALAAVGIERWLGALASGYAQIVVRLPTGMLAGTRHELQVQATLARALLRAVGQPEEAIVLDDGKGTPLSPPAANASLRTTPASPSASKRDAMLAALIALERRALPPMPGAPRELPPGAPFGTVMVDRQRCTSCTACTHLCPTGALLAADAGCSLQFVESLCVQCGLCERGCPESAITLQPRWLLGQGLRDTARTLQQAAAHHCPGCGKAFVSAALLAKSMAIVRDSLTLDRQGRELLSLCPACRARRTG